MVQISRKLIESIKILEGKIFHIDLHNQRMNYSRKELFGRHDFINLQDHLHVPKGYQTGLVKCRVIYTDIVEKIYFEHYKKRNLQRLKIIHCNTINYRHKYADRSVFERLTHGLPQDTEVIIIKNGYVTDTSYTNILLFDGKEWHTPHHALLKGIQRTHLLAEKKIREVNIKIYKLNNYTEIQFINALLDFETNIIKLPLQQSIIPI